MNEDAKATEKLGLFGAAVRMSASVGVPVVLSLFFAWFITSTISSKLDKLTASVDRLTIVMEAKK